MGKVTVIVQSPEESTTEIERILKEDLLNMAEFDSFIKDCQVFIVPDDEEYPDLS